MHFIVRLTYLNMKRRKARTILTLLGVTIGVIAVVSLLALGIGAKKEILSEFGDDASICRIVVQSPGSLKNKKMLLTDHNMEKLEAIDHVERVYPQYEINAELQIDQYDIYSNMIGIPSEELQNLVLTEDSQILQGETKPTLILGNSIGYMMFHTKTGLSYADIDGKAEALIGEKVQAVFTSWDMERTEIRDNLKVSGVIAGDADTFSDQSQSIYCDIDVLIRYLKRLGDSSPIGQPVDQNGRTYSDWVYTSAVVVAEDMDDVDFIVKKLQDMGYQTSNPKEYLDSAKKMVRVMQLLLGGIGMIALIVAVIGISNTMTTAVYDRVDEIGLLKVLGCDIDELRMMYLLESGMFGFAGGILGVAFSFGFKHVINKIAVSALMLDAGTKLAVLPPTLCVCAVIASTVLGIAAGYFPARWASRLNPLEAMRKS